MKKIEQAVLRGGLFSMAMPRGTGKALDLKTPFQRRLVGRPWAILKSVI